MTGYGFCGPMTAMGTTFADKDGAAVARTSRLMMMGIGTWLFWILLH
jgi:hypothetical protein